MHIKTIERGFFVNNATNGVRRSVTYMYSFIFERHQYNTFSAKATHVVPSRKARNLFFWQRTTSAVCPVEVCRPLRISPSHNTCHSEQPGEESFLSVGDGNHRLSG
jgi:hypothetical protein